VETRPPGRDWAGLAAVVLAAGVSLTLVIAICENAFNGHALSVEEASIYAGVIGGIVGALATFIGGGRRPPST
jgi:Na+/H+ antiporter NhaA